MFKPVQSKVVFPALEEQVLRFWKENDIFHKSVTSREGSPVFVFYEGPPTANGTPGIHHVLARVFKDVVLRYRTMRGFQVPRKAGWDTHGLPVELEVEKELGFSGKQQIESYGVAEFNRKCRESVFRYINEWESMTDRIAFWLDMAHPYVTYANGYIESGWWIVKQLWDRGLVYQGYKVTPHCPRCGTSLSSHEVALGYKDDANDPSVYIKFTFKRDEAGLKFLSQLPDPETPTYFLVWTTTPWTLPGNAALAVSADSAYAVIETTTDRGTERLIMAKALVDQVIKSEFRELASMAGVDLKGLNYEPLYTWLPLETPAHRVITGDFVSMEDGTGIVHIAPAFGEIDLEVGRIEGLPIIQPVDLRGEMSAGPEGIRGKFVKQADPLIDADLKQRGLMYRSERVIHTYPFCWRCDTPLLYYAKAAWYFRTTAKKSELLAGNEKINWYPEHIKHGRFGDWLENNVDWAFSRERYWGTPVPVWRCESCGEMECLGSVADLKARAKNGTADKLSDLHRPYVDQVALTCPKCGSDMRRVPEVMDCWFDSGAMPVAQWHYPQENKELFQQRFPADFICEAVDQTRGWFYSLHALSTMLFDRPSFKNVICLGHILDAKGEKMSKSRGNVVDPWSVLNSHGADALRWYLYTASPAGQARRFSADLVGETLRKFILTLWNTYSFFVIYANIDQFDPRSVSADLPRSDLDRWIRGELHQLIADVTERFENYDPTGAGRDIQGFVDDLSNWYVRRSRRRFWKSENDTDKLAAYATLYESLVAVAKLMAPLAPFLAEEIYQNLVRTVDASAPESVHIAFYPEADLSLVDQQLIGDTKLVMRVVGMGRAARSKANVKVRQPLSTLKVKVRSTAEAASLQRMAAQILDELNVKNLEVVDDESALVTFTIKPNFGLLGPKYGKEVGKVTAALKNAEPTTVAVAVRGNREVQLDGYTLLPEEVVVESSERPGFAAVDEAGYMVALSTTLTPELVDEGTVRELVHRLQTMRKSAGFEIADNIVIYYNASPDVERVLRAYEDFVRQETLARALRADTPPDGAYVEEQDLGKEKVVFGVKKS